MDLFIADRGPKGAGPTLVFTHGYADSHATWDRQVAEFERTSRVLAWDLRGHGASAKPESPDAYTRTTALADLADVVAFGREQNSGAVVLVGHSLGGYLSLHHAICRPADVAALVLVATGPGFRDDARREKWGRALRASTPPPSVSPHAARLAEQPDAFVIDHLTDITVPVLVVVGTADTRFRRAADVLTAHLPRAEQVVVDDAGHDVHRSHAGAVNRAMTRFLGRL